MADHEHDHDEGGGEFRTTSPMQAFTARQVAVGLAVLAVGVVVTFLLPYLLT